MSRLMVPTPERSEALAAAAAAAEAEAQHVAATALPPNRREAERRAALRLLSQSEESAAVTAAAAAATLPLLPPVAAKSLPVLATAGDVREVVQFLKKRPKGVTIIEAMDADKKRAFEPRKVSAYEFWGIILRSGDRLRLSQLGWEFARRIEPEAHVYRAVLDNSAPYRAVLEWIYHQSLEIVPQTDVAAYWTNHHREALDQNNEKIVEGNVVCFFHLCQAAELGTVTIGKRGQPARLRVDRDELLAYIEARPLAAIAGEPRCSGGEDGGGAEAPVTPADEFFSSPPPQALMPAEAAARPRVFLSHAGGANIVGQILLALELTDVESQVVERGRSAGHPVPAGVVQVMRQCSAGLIVVTAGDFAVDAAGAYVLNEAVRNEISAAFALYDRRVLLLWERHVPVPANLQSLTRWEFENHDLTWDAGVRLLKAVREFTHGAPRAGTER